MRRALSVFVLLATASAAHADRPDTPGGAGVFRFDDGDVIETFDTERFRVHFTRDGVHAVPPADEDASGVPDYVETVGDTYERVLDAFLLWGFDAPLSDADVADDNGGDERFDVYLVDFFGSADGSFQTDTCVATACVGHMIQENDFARSSYPTLAFATSVLASHELFHAVQAAYDASENDVLREGSAVWASERWDPALGELAAFAPGFLARPDRPVDQSMAGAVLDPFAYGAGLFFTFLSERYGDDLVLRLWEETRGEETEWLAALADVLVRDHATTIGDALIEHATWNWFTGARADDAYYTIGADLPEVTMEETALPIADERPRHFRAATRYYAFRPGSRTQVHAALVGDREGLALRMVRFSDPPVLSDIEDERLVMTADRTPMALAVINTAIEGSSRRASVCVGDSVEVDACLARLAPMEDPDAGPMDPDAGATDPDAGAPVDAGGADAGGESSGGGCGCRTLTAPDGGGGMLSFLLSFWIVQTRRRWRARKSG